MKRPNQTAGGGHMIAKPRDGRFGGDGMADWGFGTG